MAKGVEKVVEIIAADAIQQLATAAIQLISGQARRAINFDDPGTNGTIIFADTKQYVNDQFTNEFNYFYNGAGSTPPELSGLIMGFNQDIIVWDPSNNSESDLQNYLKLELQGTLPDQDTIFVSQNIAGLFAQRFGAQDLSWTPFTKRYNLSNNVKIDLQMVTSAGVDDNNNPMGIATFCWVAYTIASL